MPQRRILFFANAQLTAYRASGGMAVAEGHFGADPAGLEAFASYLAARRRTLFLLLADVAEEAYQTEDIPYCSGRDRRAIVTRKLAQHFYGTPYALAQSQGRLADGRRDERLLMMALTQPQHLAPWLQVLHERRCILAGLYALPQLLGALLPERAPAQLLLLTLTQAGLRQTFFAGGQMRFSRLTPLIEDSVPAIAAAAASEAAKMLQYLASQRLIERDAPLATLMLAGAQEAAAVLARCREVPGLHFGILDPAEVARRVGWRDTPLATHADALFCHLLARKPPDEQFAPPAELKAHRRWQVRFALQAGAALLFAASAVFAVHRGIDLLKLQDDIAAAEQQTLLNETRYAEKLKTLPQIPLGTEELRALVTRYDEVVLRAQGPTPLLVLLSRSLDAFPTIGLDRIEWSLLEQWPAGEMPPGAAALGPGPYAQVTIAARLPVDMVGNQRGQLALVADFAKHLGATPGSLATLLQPPVDTQSGKTLKSGDEHGNPEAPRFRLRLVRKL